MSTNLNSSNVERQGRTIGPVSSDTVHSFDIVDVLVDSPLPPRLWIYLYLSFSSAIEAHRSSISRDFDGSFHGFHL